MPPESRELHAELNAKLPGSMIPLAPRRKIQRKEKKARAPKAEGAEGETKKKTKSGKEEKKSGEDQVAAFVRGVPHADAGLPSATVVKNGTKHAVNFCVQSLLS